MYARLNIRRLVGSACIVSVIDDNIQYVWLVGQEIALSGNKAVEFDVTNIKE